MKKILKKINSMKEIILKYTDDFFFAVGLCLFVHSSFRLNSIFGEYILSLIVIFITILITKYKSEKR